MNVRSPSSSFFLSIIFLIILSSLVLSSQVIASASINLPSLEERTFIFEPGFKKTWTWSIGGSSMVEAYLSGDLTDYATLKDDDPRGGPRSVSFSLSLPEELPPGRYVLYLNAREASPGGMIGGRAAAGGGIVIISLYPTPYLKAEIGVSDTAVGDPTTAVLSLTSWSKVDAPDVWADIVIKDQGGRERLRTSSLHVAVPARGSQKLIVPLPTVKLEAGRYVAEATIHGAQPNLSARRGFKVGELDLSLRDYTRVLSADTPNRFTFKVENRWNQKLDDVVGRVELWRLNELTPSTILEGFGTASLKTYLDLTGFNATTNKTLNGTITVSYVTPEGEAGRKSFPFEVTVLPENVPLVPISNGVVTTESPKDKHNILSTLNNMTILYIVLLILVILNIVLLFRKGGGEKIVIKPPEVR